MMQKIIERLDYSVGKNITHKINDLLKKSSYDEGFIHIKSDSDTASLVLTNSFDDKTYADVVDEVNRNFPIMVDYATVISPRNAAARAKSTILGESLTLTFKASKVNLGSSQAIIAFDFDGPKDVGFKCFIYGIKSKHNDVVPVKTNRKDMIDIKDLIETSIKNKNIKNGLVHVFVPHSTAALTVYDKDKEAVKKLETMMNHLIPDRIDFKHRETPADSAGHIKSAMWGVARMFAIVDGKINLPKDQTIYFCEYDGPRNRRVITTYYGGKENEK